MKIQAPWSNLKAIVQPTIVDAWMERLVFLCHKEETCPCWEREGQIIPADSTTGCIHPWLSTQDQKGSRVDPLVVRPGEEVRWRSREADAEVGTKFDYCGIPTLNHDVTQEPLIDPANQEKTQHTWGNIKSRQAD